SRLLAGANPEDRQGLHRPLVDPAGGQLAFPGDAHLDARRIGQVDNVIHHAVGLAPGGLPAGALVVVALFGADDAAVALGEPGEAGVAVALAETLVGLAAAVAAVDDPQVTNAQALADVAV